MLYVGDMWAYKSHSTIYTESLLFVIYKSVTLRVVEMVVWQIYVFFF